MYYYLMVSNLLLRLSWTYKLSPHLRHNFDTVLLFTLLEVRRVPWPAGLSWCCSKPQGPSVVIP